VALEHCGRSSTEWSDVLHASSCLADSECHDESTSMQTAAIRIVDEFWRASSQTTLPAVCGSFLLVIAALGSLLPYAAIPAVVPWYDLVEAAADHEELVGMFNPTVHCDIDARVRRMII
jgi:hypothetical protein